MLKWLVVSLEDQNGGAAPYDGAAVAQNGTIPPLLLNANPSMPSLNSPRRRMSQWGSCSPESGQSPEPRERQESGQTLERALRPSDGMGSDRFAQASAAGVGQSSGHREGVANGDKDCGTAGWVQGLAADCARAYADARTFGRVFL